VRLVELEPATCCLEDVSAPSGLVCRVRSSQVGLGAESGQSPAVRSGYGRWNDTENDSQRKRVLPPDGRCTSVGCSRSKCRSSCAVRSARLRPASSTAARLISPASTDANAPFDPLCGATSYVGGYGARLVGSPRAEERVAQERRKPCPSDILGTWSRHGNPGDSRFLPSGSPLRSWPPWWPRLPWSPATPHRQRRPGRPAAHTRRTRPGRRRHRRRPPPPPRARVSRAPHAPRRPPNRTPPRSPNPPPAGHRPRLAARRPPGP
jgi:hypothetical protein